MYQTVAMGHDLDLTATDVRVWVGSRDFATSRAFYNALGWSTAWTDGEALAQLELAGHRFMLQDYFERNWNHNSMMTIDVANAAAWFDHATAVLASGDFAEARVAAPTTEDFGAIVTYVWDPSGVLLHFTQWLAN
jgi:hypothetical protein